MGDADLMLSVMEVHCVQGFNDYEVIGRSMGTVSISSDVAVLVFTPGVDGSQIRRMKPYFVSLSRSVFVYDFWLHLDR